MSDYHSIWLMPASADAVLFDGIVRNLAGEFSTPVFQPHLTLVEDMPRSPAELQPLLEVAARGQRELAVRIEAVTGSDLYFRSLYAAFDKLSALMELKRRAIASFGVGDIANFLPHVSLAYGVADGADKQAAIARLHMECAGRTVLFDRLAIVSSSQHTPIEDWKIVAEIALAVG